VFNDDDSEVISSSIIVQKSIRLDLLYRLACRSKQAAISLIEFGVGEAIEMIAEPFLPRMPLPSELLRMGLAAIPVR
jgi:hypothetical protein